MKPASDPGIAEARLAPLLGWVVFFSVFVNLLMLTGPLFMLQVYDRVLSSRSEPTLLALSGLVAVLFAFMGLIDHLRARIATRAGARFQAAADGALCRNSHNGGPKAAANDAVAVRQALSAPVGLAVCDLPWTPVFLFTIFLFHSALGWLALFCLIALSGLLLAAPFASRHPAAVARSESGAAEAMSRQAMSVRDDLRALGLAHGIAARWQARRMSSLMAEVRVADRSGAFRAAGRAFRFFVQSAMLALGAFLVIREELTAGAMIAASVLLGRALAPIDQVIAGWPLLERGLAGWRATRRRLAEVSPDLSRTDLPRPVPELVVSSLTLAPPGTTRACLTGVAFRLGPGEALGVIGPTGAGKSTLARALAGASRPVQGEIRLGGAPIDRYGDGGLARDVGYLPQDVALFPGTIAENIARMAMVPESRDVVRAARAAGAHDLILRLERGYDTLLDETGGGLSGGQRQRIGLARALYSRPVLLVLDEPNSSLDSEGQQALSAAIRAHKAGGGAVVVMAHRPAAIAECDRLMVLEAGRMKAIGPRDEILRAELRNHALITPHLSRSERA